MHSRDRVKVILVTNDVAEKVTARRLLDQERRAGTYHPLIVKRQRTIRNHNRVVYAVCRLPVSREDRVFIHELEVLDKQVERYTRLDPIVIEVRPSQLLEEL